MPPPSGPAVEEVLRLLPFAAAAALQRVAVGRGEGEALSVRLEIPVARSGRYQACQRGASYLKLWGAPSWGGWDAKGFVGGRGLLLPRFCRFLGEPAPGVLLRPGQRCSSRLRLEGGLCPLPG